MRRPWVVGDRTTGRFRCGESGIPAAAHVKGRRVTEPPYELGNAVMGVEQREVGRWNWTDGGGARSQIAERLKRERCEQAISCSHSSIRWAADVDGLW